MQSEINAVFENFHIPQPEATSTPPGCTKNNGSSTRSLSAVQSDNNLLPAAEEEEKAELRGTPTTTAVIMDNDSAAVARSSILPYPRGADCREVADWANSVMKECEELVIDVIDSRPSSLLVATASSPSAAACVPEEWAPAQATSRHSYADHDVERQSMTLMATRTPLSGAAAAENSDASLGDFRRSLAGPKPDKLVRLLFSLTITRYWHSSLVISAAALVVY